MSEYIVSLDGSFALDLENQIFLSMRTRQRTGQNQFSTEFLVKEITGLKIEVFANEHPPPHFRVKHADGVANYRISDCVRINGRGKILKHERAIRKWWEDNKGELINAWNNHRPSGCPVGEYREGHCQTNPA